TVTEFFVGGLAIGEITGDLGVAEQFTVLAPERRDDHVRPEAGAILLDAPTLVFAAPMNAIVTQLGGGPTAREVLVRVDAGQVFAHDFFLGIALDGLGALAPTGDLSLVVQQKDRIVPHRVRHELEQLWTGLVSPGAQFLYDHKRQSSFSVARVVTARASKTE